MNQIPALLIRSRSDRFAIYVNRYPSVTRDLWACIRSDCIVSQLHHLYPAISFFAHLQDNGFDISYVANISSVPLSNVYLFAQDLSSDICRLLASVKRAQPTATAVTLLSEYPFYQRRFFSSSVLEPLMLFIPP